MTPADFEELRKFMMKKTDGEERLAAVRTLFSGAFWCLKLGIRDDTMRDLNDILRFEGELRLAKEKKK